MRGTAPHDRLVLAVAVAFMGAHLLWLPSHLEDIDSINFALGVGDYDVAAHRPHPPGYPLLMLLAKGTATMLAPFVQDDLRRATVALALLASVTGALAIVAMWRLLCLTGSTPAVPAANRKGRDTAAVPGGAGLDGGRAGTSGPLVTTLLLAATPLFWVTAARPLSDMPGLAAALTCQWLLLRAALPGSGLRLAYGAALACGLAVGLRSQVTWLVVPLLLWLWTRLWRRHGITHVVGVAVTALAGVSAWLVPMVALAGGPSGYRAALAAQAGEDFEGVPMLVLQPGVRRLLQALLDTFVSPWGWWPVAALVLPLALLGLVAVRRQQLRLVWLAFGFAPYLAFHLLFQETETTRYALPVVPWVAALAGLALTIVPQQLARALAIGLVAVPLAVSVQAHRQYVGAGASVSETLEAMRQAARGTASRPQVVMHRRVWAETRRARTLYPASAAGYDVLPAPKALEWQEAIAVWTRDPAATVWWLVDPRRGDRAAIDPRGLQRRAHVGWPAPAATVLGGMRPHPFDWYEVRRPQWILGNGWGLTPELAGLSAAAGQGPSTTGATAHVRAWEAGGTLLIGGRNLAPAGSTPVEVDVRLGSRWSQRVSVGPGPFANTFAVPAQEPSGALLPLHVRATGPGAEHIVLEQFDAQPAGVPVVALEAGWYEPERDVSSGRTWRWTGDRSVLRVAGASGDVRVVVEGTWPRHYDRDPVLEMFVGDRRVAAHVLTRPFSINQTITDELLRAGAGRVEWRVSPSFVAGERTGTADARRLALEITALRADLIR